MLTARFLNKVQDSKLHLAASVHGGGKVQRNQQDTRRYHAELVATPKCIEYPHDSLSITCGKAARLHSNLGPAVQKRRAASPSAQTASGCDFHGMGLRRSFPKGFGRVFDSSTGTAVGAILAIGTRNQIPAQQSGSNQKATSSCGSMKAFQGRQLEQVPPVQHIHNQAYPDRNFFSHEKDWKDPSCALLACSAAQVCARANSTCARINTARKLTRTA